jgi:hypothetical protein
MTVEFPVEPGHIMAFARAIGDDNPLYDVTRTDPADVVAPPTFVQASSHFDPDYPLRPKHGRPWRGSGGEATGTPSGDTGRGLHAEQHYEYFGVVRAGDVLCATVEPGRTWEKQGRSGRLVFSESITEYRRTAGELVVRARSVSVKTERPPVTGRSS